MVLLATEAEHETRWRVGTTTKALIGFAALFQFTSVLWVVAWDFSHPWVFYTADLISVAAWLSWRIDRLESGRE